MSYVYSQCEGLSGKGVSFWIVFFLHYVMSV